MATRLQKALVWLVIGAFVAPSLLGTALHCLPGQQHGCCDTACCGVVAEHCCDSPDHDHDSVPLAASAGVAASHDSACPICHFLASGKVLSSAQIDAHPLTAAEHAPPPVRIFIARSDVQPHAPRGPPLG